MRNCQKMVCGPDGGVPEELQTVLKRHPENVEVRLELARSLLERGHAGEALFHLRLAEPSAASLGEFRYLLGLAHLATGDVEVAVGELLGAERALPGDPRISLPLVHVLDRWTAAEGGSRAARKRVVARHGMAPARERAPRLRLWTRCKPAVLVLVGLLGMGGIVALRWAGPFRTAQASATPRSSAERPQGRAAGWIGEQASRSRPGRSPVEPASRREPGSLGGSREAGECLACAASPRITLPAVPVVQSAPPPDAAASPIQAGCEKGDSEATDKLIRYLVKPGDTLFRIARNHGTTVAELQRANSLTDNSIRWGMMLAVPSASDSSAGPCGSQAVPGPREAAPQTQGSLAAPVPSPGRG